MLTLDHFDLSIFFCPVFNDVCCPTKTMWVIKNDKINASDPHSLPTAYTHMAQPKLTIST